MKFALYQNETSYNSAEKVPKEISVKLGHTALFAKDDKF